MKTHIGLNVGGVGADVAAVAGASILIALSSTSALKSARPSKSKMPTKKRRRRAPVNKWLIFHDI